jgi:hypothetical protein
MLHECLRIELTRVTTQRLYSNLTAFGEELQEISIDKLLYMRNKQLSNCYIEPLYWPFSTPSRLIPAVVYLTIINGLNPQLSEGG